MCNCPPTSLSSRCSFTLALLLLSAILLAPGPASESALAPAPDLAGAAAVQAAADEAAGAAHKVDADVPSRPNGGGSPDGPLPYPIFLAVYSHDSMFGICNASGCVVALLGEFAGEVHIGLTRQSNDGWRAMVRAVKRTYGPLPPLPGGRRLQMPALYGNRPQLAKVGCPGPLVCLPDHPQLPQTACPVLQKSGRLPGETEVFALGIAEGNYPPKLRDSCAACPDPTTDSQRTQLLNLKHCHHHAHAALGFFDSPFSQAVVITADGWSWNGNYNVWRINRTAAYRLHPPGAKSCGGGKFWRQASLLLQMSPDTWYKTHLGKNGIQLDAHLLEVYSQLGKPEPALYTRYRTLLDGDHGANPVDEHVLKQVHSTRGYRAAASSLQSAFEDKVLQCAEQIRSEIESAGALVLSGGLHWNTFLNTAYFRKFKVPVHVAPYPGDGGLPLGTLWAVQHASGLPIKTIASDPYIGLPLHDAANVSKLAALHHAVECSVQCLSTRLTQGAIVGVIRGRQSFAKWSLGERSLFADPRTPVVRRRINRMQLRESWFPLCVTVPEEHSARVSEDGVLSPYRSFSVRVSAAAQVALPAVNATSQLHTVPQASNPWLHRLLLLVGQETGWPVLLSSDLMQRKGALLNSAQQALRWMQRAGLEYLWIDGYLLKGGRGG